MSKAPKAPKYRKHKASGQAAVTIDGTNHYLGKFGTIESREKYAKLLGEHFQSLGQSVPDVSKLQKLTSAKPKGSITVVAAGDRYLAYSAANHGVSEKARVKGMLKVFVGLFENEQAAAIAPAQLREVRDAMVAKGWSRTYVNEEIGTLKRMYKWLATEQLIPVDAFRLLQLVEGLKKGKSSARESEAVLPVKDATVDATLPRLPKIVADMVRLERLTGMRPGEVCILRPCDIDRTGKVWLYKPAKHKTEHFDKDREVYIGPNAQEILLPYLKRDGESYCFQPRESEAKRRVPRGRGTKQKTEDLADHYDACTYRRAIHRACDKAFPHPAITKDADAVPADELREWKSEHRWSPNQLRHTRLTEVRKKYGLEAAQVIGGHSNANVTQIYAERDRAKGVKIASEIG